MYSEATQVIHEHADPTHIKESGNTSHGHHHRRSLGRLAGAGGASLHNEV